MKQENTKLCVIRVPLRCCIIEVVLWLNYLCDFIDVVMMLGLVVDQSPSSSDFSTQNLMPRRLLAFLPPHVPTATCYFTVLHQRGTPCTVQCPRYPRNPISRTRPKAPQTSQLGVFPTASSSGKTPHLLLPTSTQPPFVSHSPCICSADKERGTLDLCRLGRWRKTENCLDFLWWEGVLAGGSIFEAMLLNLTARSLRI